MASKKVFRTDIHRNGWPYRLLRIHTDICTWLSYRKMQVTGRESIPADGSVMFAPNHSNALMDAMVLLRTRRTPTVYGARADLFESRFIAWFLHFLKIVPMIRRRDGIRKVLKNLDIQEDIIEVLEERVPFCMFAEGTHRTMHSLLPIGKGIFRIAVTAADRLPHPVYVIPVGMEYGDYFRYGSTALTQFGEPINVSEYVAQNKEKGEAVMYRELTGILRDRISGMITFIPDDENYDAVWAYTKLATVGKRKGALTACLAENRRAVASVLPADAPGTAEKLSAALELDRRLHSAGISVLSLGHPGLGRFLLKTLGLLLWLPFQIASGVIALPTLAAAEYLVRFGVVRDEAFFNSVRYGLYAVMFPVPLIIWTLLGTFVFHFGFWASYLGSLVLCYLATPAFYRGLECYRVWLSDLKLLFRKDLVKRHRELFK